MTPGEHLFHGVKRLKHNELCPGCRMLRPRLAAFVLNTFRTLLALSAVNGLSRDDIEKLVKDAVYVPAKGAQKEMFKLGAHGIVYEWNRWASE